MGEGETRPDVLGLAAENEPETTDQSKDDELRKYAEDTPYRRVIDAENKAKKNEGAVENFGQAINDAARLEVVTRFAEQNPNHPLAEEIRKKLSSLTDKVFESIDRQESNSQRLDNSIEQGTVENKLWLMIDQIQDFKDARRQKIIKATAEELYAKVSSELDPEQLYRLAKGESPKIG